MWIRLKGGIECVCGKKDWCMVSDSGREFLCMRVQSEKQFVLKDGSVGYIHKADGEHRVKPIIIKQERKKPAVDLHTLYYDWLSATKPEWQEKLAREIAVSFSSVKSIGAAWSTFHQAWAFPMRDGLGELVGIRLRGFNGKKWAVTGSANALFIPRDDYRRQTLFVFEGPTDTCAGFTVGLRCIGRPSCSSGLFDLVRFVKRESVKEVVIVADNDKPGLDGAAVLSRHLPVPNTVLTLPCKDMREFVSTGGTDAMLMSLVKSMVWNQVIAAGGQ
jgi:hypothetical protein